jgi:penicillin-binding protein 2
MRGCRTTAIQVEQNYAAIVIDVTNGDIKGIWPAPALIPTVRPRHFVALWDELNERDVDAACTAAPAAKTVRGTCPPGSTFKMVTAGCT